MNIRKLFATLVLLAPLAVAGCKSESPAPATDKPAPSAPAEKAPAAPAEKAPAAAGGATITQAARDEAKEIFSMRCTPCHGQTGAGDGAASASLTPKPRNLQDPEWQASVTDEHIEKIIKLGGAAVGKSPMMPGNPDLAEKDAVVAALREYIRGLKK